jgi:hypothetical protein
MLDMQPAVDLESAKTDDDGHAVHGECYFREIVLKRPAAPTARRPTA